MSKKRGGLDYSTSLGLTSSVTFAQCFNVSVFLICEIAGEGERKHNFSKFTESQTFQVERAFGRAVIWYQFIKFTQRPKVVLPSSLGLINQAIRFFLQKTPLDTQQSLSVLNEAVNDIVLSNLKLIYVGFFKA